MVFIKSGTPGLVRRVGGKWVPHKATKDGEYGLVRNHTGGYLIVRQGDWEFMVLGRHCGRAVKKKAKQKTRHTTFNKVIFGRNGRGASRRRTLKRRRRQR